VKIIEERQGQKISCIEEIALRNKWISIENLLTIGESYGRNPYAHYLLNLVSEYQ
jgi:glucose-1-phosphate thymidylyltransferase